VIWARNGTVATVHQYLDANNVPNWNVLVFIYLQDQNGYLVDTGYVALNGPGTLARGNFCWVDGSNSCLNSPLSFDLNQTLTVHALNNGDFMVTNRPLCSTFRPALC